MSKVNSMTNPIVSIIIPIFKVEKFIERCLDSIKNQTYGNIEVILVNDVTPDRSMEVVDSYIKRHTHFFPIIINHETNLGLSLARNSGMDMAKGKYLYFLDSDDAIYPDAIEKLVLLAEKNNAEMVLGQSICINENEGWQRNYFPIYYPAEEISGNLAIFDAMVKNQYPIMACDKLVRRDFLMKHTLYFVKDLFSQDVLWSFHCALYFEKISFLRQNTYQYFFHEASIIHNRNKKNFDNWQTIAEYVDLEYKKESNEARKNLILQWIISFKNTTLQMNWKAQHNPVLWKESYQNYKKISGLTITHYLSKTVPSSIKKHDFFTKFPAEIGFLIFKIRFQGTLGNLFYFLKRKKTLKME